MKVNLKCFAKLSKGSECDFRESTPYEMEQGKTVYDLANQAKILPTEVEIAFVNNKIASLETVLEDGDNVGLAPAVGGM
jgi:molybdopterin converting factor small subunit